MGKRPYHAVLLVTVPADWRPTRVFHLPPTFTDARYYATRLHINAAIEVCRTHNADKLTLAEADQPVGQWMFHVRELKTRTTGGSYTPADPNSARSIIKQLASREVANPTGRSISQIVGLAKRAARERREGAAAEGGGAL